VSPLLGGPALGVMHTAPRAEFAMSGTTGHGLSVPDSREFAGVAHFNQGSPARLSAVPRVLPPVLKQSAIWLDVIMGEDDLGVFYAL
jgi:hypothetical protein